MNAVLRFLGKNLGRIFLLNKWLYLFEASAWLLHCSAAACFFRWALIWKCGRGFFWNAPLGVFYLWALILKCGRGFFWNAGGGGALSRSLGRAVLSFHGRWFWNVVGAFMKCAGRGRLVTLPWEILWYKEVVFYKRKCCWPILFSKKPTWLIEISASLIKNEAPMHGHKKWLAPLHKRWSTHGHKKWLASLIKNEAPMDTKNG